MRPIGRIAVPIVLLVVSFAPIVRVEGAGTPAAVELIWTLDGDSDLESSMFGTIRSIQCLPDGRTAILDSQLGEVRLFDANGNFIEIIGRSGEGPGEFLHAGDLVRYPPGRLSVAQSQPPKLAILGFDGVDPADWFPSDDSSVSGAMIVRAKSNGRVLIVQTLRSTVSEVAEDVGEFHVFGPEDHRGERWLRAVDRQSTTHIVAREVTPLDAYNVWSIDAVNRLAVAPIYGSYRLELYTSATEPSAVWIHEGYDSFLRSEERYAEILKRYEGMTRFLPGNATVEVERTEKDVQRIIPRPDGEFWIRTSQQQFGETKGTLGDFDVWSSEGKRQGSTSIDIPYRRDCDQYWVSLDRLYVVVGGLSAARSAIRGRPGADEILGDDPCQTADEASMSVRCYQLGSRRGTGR